MKAKKKIGIWGQFGDGGKIADGQAVRTTIITEELKNRYGEENLFILNTNNWRKHPFSFLWNTMKLNAVCEKVIIFPADNGFLISVPLLHVCNKFFKRELYDVVIGGYLPGILKAKPRYIGMLAKYRALFVQTPNLQKDLEEFGLKNVHILSNLKRLNSVKREEVGVCEDPKVKVCTLSRITESKGILYAIEAVKAANESLGETRIELDIYGIVDPEFQHTFEQQVALNRDFVRYGGVLDFDRTTETMRNYFAMLFPTYYYGEGFPGNVVDAYNAGLPIVATDWRYNKEVIHDGENGILVPPKDAGALCNALLELYHDRPKAYEITLRNIERAKEYQPDAVLQKFYEFLD